MSLSGAGGSGVGTELLDGGAMGYTEGRSPVWVVLWGLGLWGLRSWAHGVVRAGVVRVCCGWTVSFIAGEGLRSRGLPTPGVDIMGSLPKKVSMFGHTGDPRLPFGNKIGSAPKKLPMFDVSGVLELARARFSAISHRKLKASDRGLGHKTLSVGVVRVSPPSGCLSDSFKGGGDEKPTNGDGGGRGLLIPISDGTAKRWSVTAVHRAM